MALSSGVEICKILREATRAKSPELVETAYNYLTQLQLECQLPSDYSCIGGSECVAARMDNDLFLYCCEAALAVSRMDIASVCLLQLMQRGTTTKASEVRTLFCRALVESKDVSSLRCEALVQCIVDALSKVILAARVALQERLPHLVLLATRHMWNIAKPLFRDGSYHAILSTIGFGIFCQEAIGEKFFSERAHWMMRYCVALNGAGRCADALAYLGKTSELINKHVPALRLTASKLQAAFTKPAFQVQQTKGSPKGEAPRTGVVHAVYCSQGFLSGMLDANTATAELLHCFDELKALQKEMDAQAANASRLPSAQSPTRSPTASPAKKGAPPPVTPLEQMLNDDQSFRDEVLADVGLCLAILEQHAPATEIAVLLLSSKVLQVRVMGELIACWVAAVKGGGLHVQAEHHMTFLTADMERVLLDGIRGLDRTLESALRVTPLQMRSHMVQYAAIMMWNMSLPLLQSRHRAIIARSMNAAAKALDDIQSNMNELRALLHYEGCLYDMDADYLGKANTKLSKARGLDYFTPIRDVHLYGQDRPWDRFLTWTQKCLDVRSNLYQQFEDPIDAALMLVEQAREASMNNRISMITKAASILQPSEPPSDFVVEEGLNVTDALANTVDLHGRQTPLGPSKPRGGGDISPRTAAGAQGKEKPGHTTTAVSTASGKGGKRGQGGDETTAVFEFRRSPELEAKRQILRERTRVWHTALVYGWREKHATQVDICRQAANAVLSRHWPRRGDRDMLLLQADAHQKLAEMLVVELSAKKLYPGQLEFSSLAPMSPTAGAGAAEGASFLKEGLNRIAEEKIKEAIDFVTTATQQIQHHVSAMVRIGAKLVRDGFPDQCIILNGSILLWNSFLKAFEENIFACAVDGLQTVWQALSDPSLGISAEKESLLFQDVILAFVKCLIQIHVAKRIANSATLTNAHFVQVSKLNLNDISVTDSNSPALSQAWEVADFAISALRAPMAGKHFLMHSATIRRLQGKPVDVRPHPQQRLLMVIEQLGHPLGSDDKATLVHQGLELLSQDPNIELCARFAERVLMTHPKVSARAALIGKKLADEGKLGIVQNALLLLKHLPPSFAAPNTTANSGKGPSTGASSTKDNAKDKKRQQQDHAAEALAQAEIQAASAPIPEPTEDTFQWFSLLLLYKGCATFALIDPTTQDKNTQIEVHRQALLSVAQAIENATKASAVFARGHIVRYLRHLRNMIHGLAADPISRHFAFESLNLALSQRAIVFCTPLSTSKRTATDFSDAEVVAQLLLLKLRILCDNNRVEDGLALMKEALVVLPPGQHKPFWALDIQLRCEAGLSPNQTIMRVKEFGREMQAQTWLSLAKHSKDKRDQLFAFQRAAELLDEVPCAKADVLLAIAQWALQTNAAMSLDDVRSLVLSAIDTALQDLPSSKSNVASDNKSRALSTTRSDIMSVRSGGQTVASNRNGTGRDPSVTSSPQRVPQAPQQQGPTIRQLVTAVSGYFLLATVGGHRSELCDGVSVDRHACLRVAAHYVCHIWETLTNAANAHTRSEKKKAVEERAWLEMLQRQQESAAAGVSADVQSNSSAPQPPPTEGGKSDGKGTSSRRQTLIAQQIAQKREQQKEQEIAALRGIASAVGPPELTFAEEVVLPPTDTAWAGFDYPRSFIDTLRDMDSPFTLSSDTVESPQVLVVVLRDLVSMMRDEGLLLPLLPALQLLRLVADTLLFADRDPRVGAVAIEATMESWDVHHAIGASANVGIVSTEHPMPTPNERRVLLEDARLVARHNAESGTPRLLSGSFEPSAIYVTSTSGQSMPIHTAWCEIAKKLITEGRIGQARDVLQEARIHVSAYADGVSEAACCYLEAVLAKIDGRNLDSIQLANAAFLCQLKDRQLKGKFVVDAKLLIVANYLSLHDVDQAFHTHANLQASLEKQLQSSTGLAQQVAAVLIPPLQVTAAIRFVEAVTTYLKDRQVVTAGQPPVVRESGCTKSIATPTEAIQGLYLVVGLALKAARDSGYHMTEALCAEAKVRALERHYSSESYNAKELKRSLQSEYREYERVLRLLEETAHTGNEQHIATTSASVSGSAMSMATLLVEMSRNTSIRVLLNGVLVDELRAAALSDTEIPLPLCDGAPEELRAAVVAYMRSSRKVRDATQRRRQREAERKSVAVQRAAARAERQREIDRVRLQRRQDEIALQQLQMSAQKREVKAGIKTSRSKKSEESPQTSVLEPLFDVDPADKCGIDSPVTSDDDGRGEDSQSDEEEELELALSGLDDVEAEVKLSLQTALVFLTKARDLLSDTLTSSETSLLLDVEHATILRRIAEGEVMALDQRAALAAGQPLPSLTISPSLAQCWKRPVDIPVAPVEEEPAAATLSKRPARKDESKKSSKKDAAALARDLLPSTPPQAPVSPTFDAPPCPAFPPGAPPLPALNQALSLLETAAMEFYAAGSYLHVATVMHEIANCAILQNNSLLAGTALEYAHAAVMSHYVTALWLEVSASESPEAALLRLSRACDQMAPHLRQTQVRQGIDKISEHFSSMQARLSLPAPSFLTSPAAYAQSLRIPTDVAVLTLHVVPEAHANVAEIIATLRRPSGHTDVRRVRVPQPQLNAFGPRYQALSKARSQLLERSAISERQRQEFEVMAAALVTDTEALLGPLLEDFFAAVKTIAANTTLIITVHPSLQPLPVESLAFVNQFKSATRDISLFTFLQHFHRRSTDKCPAPANVLCLVDPFAEIEENACANAVFGEGTPRLPTWVNHTTTLDQHMQPRPLQVSLVLRALAQPTNGALLVDVGGRFSAICTLPEVSALRLEHLRAVVLCDKAVYPTATRRESIADMTKERHMLAHEYSFWVLPLLLLARGVDFCVTASMPVSRAISDYVAHAFATSLERPVNMVDQLAHVIPRLPPKVEQSTPAGGVGTDGPSATTQKPPSRIGHHGSHHAATDAKHVTNPPTAALTPGGSATPESITFSIADRFLYKAFGWTPFEETAPSTTAGGQTRRQ